jgi:hypothetical protein
VVDLVDDGDRPGLLGGGGSGSQSDHERDCGREYEWIESGFHSHLRRALHMSNLWVPLRNGYAKIRALCRAAA